MNKKIFFFICLISILYVNITNSMDETKKIYWENKIKQNNKIIIIGIVKESFGSFEFRWIVEGDNINLIYIEPVGSAILPPIERKLYIMNLIDGKSLIFQKWFPLVNQKEPESLRLITVVETKELYSALPIGYNKIKKIKLTDTLTRIEWEDKIIENNKENLLKGTILLNKKKLQLIIREKDSKLILNLIDEKKKYTNILPWFYKDILYICEVDEKTNTVVPLIKVKKEELSNGLKKL